MEDSVIPEETPELDEAQAATVAPEDLPGTTIPKSGYEMVVVAAREARRLNDRLRRLANDQEGEKVTTRATERVLAGQVRFAYEDDQSAT